VKLLDSLEKLGDIGSDLISVLDSAHDRMSVAENDDEASADLLVVYAVYSLVWRSVEDRPENEFM